MQESMAQAFDEHFKRMTLTKLRTELRMQEQKVLEFPNAYSTRILAMLRTEISRRCQLPNP